MTKKDLVGRIAVEARLTRVQAASALEAFLEGIRASLVQGDRVTISGFGTFAMLRIARRAASRNPRSGTSVDVAAKRVPRFAAGVDLKSAINQSPGK